MGRYLGSKHKLCRRVGEALCGSAKCPVHKRNAPPGQHGGMKRQRKLSEYGVMMLEKQKLRFIFGLLEKQFRRYFQKAARMGGKTGYNLLLLLETRLDNLVYRAGFAPSIAAARQLVRHGHIVVDGRKVDVPSFQVKVGQTVKLKEKSSNRPAFIAFVEENKDKLPELAYLERNLGSFEFRVRHMPVREEIPVAINEQLIVELYSK
ncbi:MAG: 30S ribosomal protein S4 [bacterium]|nr:30S ribosomal protein S4 [bacterium]